MGGLGALWDEVGPQFLAFGISFAVITLYWLAHHRLGRTLAALDQLTMVANLVLIASIVVIPFSTSWVGDPGTEGLPLRRHFWRSTSPSPLGSTLWCTCSRTGASYFLARPSAREVQGSLVIGLSPGAIMLASVPVAYLASPVIAQLCWLLIIPTRVVGRRLGA